FGAGKRLGVRRRRGKLTPAAAFDGEPVIDGEPSVGASESRGWFRRVGNGVGSAPVFVAHLDLRAARGRGDAFAEHVALGAFAKVADSRTPEVARNGSADERAILMCEL